MNIRGCSHVIEMDIKKIIILFTKKYIVVQIFLAIRVLISCEVAPHVPLR